MEQEREIYYRQKAIEIQKNIVNYKTSVTSTSDSFIWTYRTTTVDVISMITTTVGVHNGAMKDILLKNHEVKRIKPSSNKSGPKNGESPYDIGRSVDLEAKRKRMNEVLLTERNRFMNKLQTSRNIRYSVESKAVVKVQAIYRGYSVRTNIADIRQSTAISKQIRSNIRSYLFNQFNIDVSLSKFKKNVARIRNRSAVTIQTAYFRYLSRKCLRRKRYEQWLKNRRKAVIIIQSLVRGVAARARVKLLIERIRIVLIMKSVLKIQTIVRRHLASRRVRRRRIKLHHFASKLIQDWYRARFARKMAAHIKAMLLYKQTNNGARVMQKLVRKFLAKRRMNRIRLRCVYKLIFRYVTVIQCSIRKFIARVIVPRKRIQFKKIKEEKELLVRQKIEKEKLEKETIENKKLIDSVDLFIQARLGLTAEVEDIYTGLVSTDEHTPDEIESQTGENLLSIATELGNLDLIRKCLKWGFNMNFRNRSGHSIFMIAAKHNHLSVMKYLLAPPITNTDCGDIIPLETPFSEEDLGFLIVAATANTVLQDDLSMLKFVVSLEGANINLRNVVTGMAGIHAASEVGHVDAFKYFVNEKAELDVEDDQGQSTLHKASCCSMKITEIILGLDPTFPTYMSEQDRITNILKTDGDGKDAILYAALHGQTDILELLTSIVKKSTYTRSNSSKGDISWSASDISKAISLVEKGNLICLDKLAEIGFDFCWSEEETGRTLAIAACQSGDLNMIDLLLSHRADFAAIDKKGRNALHYASMCTKEQNIIPHLMIHANTALCQISDKCLIAQDNNGENVYHLSARANIILNIDLLAQRILNEALETKNNIGMTPLLVACSMNHQELIKNFLLLGADAKQVDTQQHGCMWHLYHPQSIYLPMSSRVVCSEYIVQQVSFYNTEKAKTPASKTNSSSFFKDGKIIPELLTTTFINGISNINPLSRKEKDDEVIRVKNDVTVIIALLRAGCTFYETNQIDSETIQNTLIYSNEEMPTLESQKDYQAGDIAVQEFSLAMFKTIIASGYLSKTDAWRILISAIWFDDGSLRVINSLVKDGIIDIILSDAIDGSSLATGSVTAGSVNTNDVSSNPFSKLQNSFFFHLTILGWAIKLKKFHVIKAFIRKPYNLSLPVDVLGNPTLHFIAMYGTADMIQLVIEANKKLRIEQTNLQGYTPGMVAAKYKNVLVAKKLSSYHSDVRRWLDVSYTGWVLALVRRKEKYECNTQTGRYGDDDETYFIIKPDPIYITWYKYTT